MQGLTALLEKNSRAHVVCQRAPEANGSPAAAAGKENILLIDASAVQYVLLDRLGSRNSDWKSGSFAEKLYRATCHFYHGIQHCGLKCVLICDGPCR